MHSFRAMLRTLDRAALGTWIKLPCTESVELAALAGFDFVVVDLEHAPLSLQTAHQLIGVAAGCGMPAMVRVPDQADSTTHRVLDSDASGVLVPHVDSAQQARAVVAATRFPPDGTRGFGPTCRAGLWGMLPAVEYQRLARDDVTCVAQLESREAVTAAADIAATPGMGALFVGPVDLSVSTGLPPDSAEFAGLLETVEQAAHEVDVPLGTASEDARQVKRLVERGYAFVLLSNDATMLGRAASALVADARELL